MIPLLTEHQSALESLCRQYGVQRLEVFGSAAEADMDSAVNDVDFLVEFAPEQDLGPWMRHYFAFRSELQALLGRSVDLVFPQAMRNPYFIRDVNRTRRLIYAAEDAQTAL